MDYMLYVIDSADRGVWPMLLVVSLMAVYIGVFGGQRGKVVR